MVIRNQPVGKRFRTRIISASKGVKIHKSNTPVSQIKIIDDQNKQVIASVSSQQLTGQPQTQTSKVAVTGKQAQDIKRSSQLSEAQKNILFKKAFKDIILKEEIKPTGIKTIEEPKPQTTGQFYSQLAKPKKTDTPLVKGVKGVLDVPLSFIGGVLDLPTKYGKNKKAQEQRIKAKTVYNEVKQKGVTEYTGTQLNELGNSIGAGVQSSDPYTRMTTLTTLGIMVLPSPKKLTNVPNTTKVTDLFKKVKKDNKTELDKINAKINDLENKGVNVRQRNKLGELLRTYQEQKRIINSSLDDLTNIIKKAQQDKVKDYTTPQKPKNPITKQEVKTVITKSNKSKKNNKKIRDLEKELKELTIQPKAPKLKVTKQLPTSKIDIENKIKEFYNDPKQLKIIKKKLLERDNLRFNIYVKDKKIKVVFKEAGEQKKAGVKTRRKDKKYLVTEKGQLLRVDKRKGTKDTAPTLTAKEKRRLEKDEQFREGQNLELVKKDLIRMAKGWNKKGHSQAPQQFKTTYKYIRNVVNDGVKTANGKVQAFRKQYKLDKQKQPINPKGKYKNWTKEDKARFNKQKVKVKTELKKAITNKRKFDSMTRQLFRLLPAFAKDFNKSFKLDQAKTFQFENLFKFIQDVNPPSKPKPTGNEGNGGGRTGTGRNKTGGTGGRTPTKPPSKPPRKLTRPPKKPKIIPKPKFKIPRNIEKELQNKKGEIRYKEGNKVVKIKTGLPFYQAQQVASKSVDNSVKASMEVVAYGKTKKPYTTKPSLKKFTIKKGKNPLVQRLVEKKKYRIDSTGEKKGLKLKSFIKKQIGKYKKKK